MDLRTTVIGAACALCVAIACKAAAGEAIVVAATATAQGGDVFRIDATVSHGDTGWEHYADAWRVETPDGAVLGERALLHPHVDEQPFTRSLSGVVAPAGLSAVAIRARDSVHGWATTTAVVALPGR